MARILRPLALTVAAFAAGAFLNPFASDATARPSSRPLQDVPLWMPTTTSVPNRHASESPSLRTEAGAVAAAAAFVCTGQQLIDMSDGEVDAFLRRLVSNSAAERIVAGHLRDLAALREVLAPGTGPIVYRQGVLAHRVQAFDGDTARVSIWHVGVLARVDVAPPQAGWMVSTVDLRWERGEWKVVDEIALPGPAPILNDSVAPATADELLHDLDGFTDFGGSR